MQIRCGPVICRADHEVGKVDDGGIWIAHVGREHRRGQGTDLDAHGREGGENDCKGAAAEAGEVVNGGDAGQTSQGSSSVLCEMVCGYAIFPLSFAPAELREVYYSAF